MAEDAASRAPALPIVIVGHVDHGKSTLVGRLLHDCGGLPEGKLDQLKEMALKRGMSFEWSFVMDALQVERDQGITLDVTQIWFRTVRRRYVIIDAPGHREFLRNMVTGAAAADGAILVVDVVQGVSEQTRRHAYLLSLLGLRQVAVVVNKLDLVDFDQARFLAVAAEIGSYLGGLGITPSAVIPAAARHGDNVALLSPRTPWYSGPSVTEALDAFAVRPPAVDQPLRLPVQDVYRFSDRRVIVGRIETGRLKVGDTLRFAPGNAMARVKSIESWNDPHRRVSAAATQSVAITLDQDIFVERGHLASSPESLPTEDHLLKVRLFWLDRAALAVGDVLRLRLATAETEVVVDRIERVIDVQDLSHVHASQVERNGVAEVVLRSRGKLAFDGFDVNQATGRAVLIRDFQLAGGCIVTTRAEAAASPAAQPDASVGGEERARANGHAGGVLWLTGLSGAGKSTLANALVRRLFDRGRQAYALDGDVLRQGLSHGLGFSPEDRRENIRRAAEAARILADAGFIVVAALISPARDDRALARAVIGQGFHEIHVAADLATCRARDPKGLYADAYAGRIAGFTGVSAPYEPPAAPDLLIDTAAEPVERSTSRLLAYAEAAFVSRHREFDRGELGHAI